MTTKGKSGPPRITNTRVCNKRIIVAKEDVGPCTEPTIDPRSPCIEWDGARQSNGYALRNTRTLGGWVMETVARRIVADRDGLDYHDWSWDTRHSCDNPPCVNEEHLLSGDRRENILDRPVRSSCGYRGVNRNSWGKWQARIMIAGKRLYLGTFATPEEASAVYQNAAVFFYGDRGRK